jgi:glutathione S-transferase
MVREHQTSDAQLRIGESRDSGFDASHRPGMTREVFDMLILYFAPGSSSFAVHIALHEVGVPFEGKPMSFKADDLRSPAYLALNAEGKVPTLIIDGRPLTEVAAILYYLAKRFPDAGLLPRDDIEAEAQALSWMSFAASTLHPARRAEAAACQGSLGNCRSAAGKRLGARPLFDRRYPSLSAVLAVRQFAQACARNLSQSHRALSAHDGSSRRAANDRHRIRDRV